MSIFKRKDPRSNKERSKGSSFLNTVLIHHHEILSTVPDANPFWWSSLCSPLRHDCHHMDKKIFDCAFVGDKHEEGFAHRSSATAMPIGGSLQPVFLHSWLPWHFPFIWAHTHTFEPPFNNNHDEMLETLLGPSSGQRTRFGLCARVVRLSISRHDRALHSERKTEEATATAMGRLRSVLLVLFTIFYLLFIKSDIIHSSAHGV